MIVTLLIGLLSGASTPPNGAAPLCASERARVAALSNRTPGRARPLAEAPPADVVLAVLRTEDGCSRPVRVRRVEAGR